MNDFDRASALMPQVAWSVVFDHLDHPTDLRSLVEASPFFKTLLQPRMEEFMFAAVLDDLLKKKYITGAQDIYHCRIINSYAKRVVDANLEQVIPDHFKSGQNYFADTMWRAPPEAFKLYQYMPGDAHSIIERLKHMEHYHARTNSCPFPRRHLCLQESFEPQPSSTIDRIFQRKRMTLDFLDVAGHHFWYCDMRITCHGMLASTSWYRQIVEFGRRMPNLKALLLSYPGGEKHGYQDSPQRLYQVLLHPTGEFVFPTLNNLNMLIIMEVPTGFTSAVLRANRGVPALQLGNRLISEMSECDSLQSLSFQVSNREELLGSFHDHQYTFKQLKIDLESSHRSLISCSDIFSFLERFRETLTQLQLRLPTRITAFHLEDMRLDLPNLTELRLHVFDTVDMDFLSGLTSLKKLFLNVVPFQALGEFHFAFMVSHGDPDNHEATAYMDRLVPKIWETILSLNYIEVTIMSRIYKLARD